MRLRAMVALIAVLAASPALAGWTKLVNNGSYTGARPMFVTNSNGVYVTTYKSNTATNSWVRTQSNGTQSTHNGASPSTSGHCLMLGVGWDGTYIYESGGACGSSIGTNGRWQYRSNSATLASWSSTLDATDIKAAWGGSLAGGSFGTRGYRFMQIDAFNGTLDLGDCTATVSACTLLSISGMSSANTYAEMTSVQVTSGFYFGAYLGVLSSMPNVGILTRGINGSEAKLFDHTTVATTGYHTSKGWSASAIRPAWDDGTLGYVAAYDSTNAKTIVIAQNSSGADQCATCDGGAQVISGDWRPLTATNAAATYDLDGSGAKTWLMKTDGTVRYYSGGDFVRPGNTSLDLTLDSSDTITGWTLDASGAPFVTTVGGDVFTASTFAPSVTLTAGASSVARGATTTLTWTVTGATSCTASGAGDWTGSKSTSGGSATVTVSAATTYTLSCTGGGGTTAPTVAVSVTARGGARQPPSLSGSL